MSSAVPLNKQADAEVQGEATKARFRGSKKWPATDKITVLVEENPKRTGGKAHARFALYRTGMTVDEFVSAGGTYADLQYDSDHKFISVGK